MLFPAVSTFCWACPANHQLSNIDFFPTSASVLEFHGRKSSYHFRLDALQIHDLQPHMSTMLNNSFTHPNWSPFLYLAVDALNLTNLIINPTLSAEGLEAYLNDILEYLFLQPSHTSVYSLIPSLYNFISEEDVPLLSFKDNLPMVLLNSYPSVLLGLYLINCPLSLYYM